MHEISNAAKEAKKRYDKTEGGKLAKARAQRKYRQTDKGKLASNKTSAKHTNKNRLALLEFLNDSKCIKCGFDDIRALQIDHINGGGGKEVKRFGGAQPMIKYYLDHLNEANDNLQLLCANCNWIKRSINEETRFKRKE